jgi:DNA-binding transcriptional regulator of glucitol operon
MKCLLLLSLVAVAVADDLIITGCLMENWDETNPDMAANMNQVGKCIKCFESSFPLTEAGLVTAKSCAAEYLKLENEACSESVAAVDLANEDSMEALEECLEEWQMTAAGEYCLARSTSETPVDIITDSIGCLMEAHRNVTKFEHYISNLGGPKGNKGKGPRKLQQRRKGGKGGEMKKYIMGQLLPKAYCNVANDKDETRQAECDTCFADLPKGPKAFAGAKDCSQKYLSSEYQECQTDLNKLNDFKGKESKKIMKCFAKRTLRYVVEQCNPTAGDLENLWATYDCGKEFIVNWVEDNAEAKYAEKIIDHLEDEDSSEEED